MSRRAFSIIEITIAMGLMAILAGVTLVSYRGHASQAARVACKEDLVQVRRAIDRWQVEKKRPWFRPGPPEGARPDPWGQPFQVEPKEGVIWSLGPSGDTSSAETAGDLSLAYTPYPSQPPGSPRSLRGVGGPGGGVLLSWVWPTASSTAIGYRILRADGPAAEFQEIGAVSAAEPLEFHDPDPEPGQTRYYRIQAQLGPGAAQDTSPPSRPFAITVPHEGRPVLELESSIGSISHGVAGLFRVSGYGVGASLDRLEFQGEVHPVGPGRFRLDLPWSFEAAGEATVEATLFDTAGKSTTRTLDVTVY